MTVRAVFEFPQIIDDCGGGWCVPCDDVTGEVEDVAIECGPVSIVKGEFFDSQ